MEKLERGSRFCNEKLFVAFQFFNKIEKKDRPRGLGDQTHSFDQRILGRVRLQGGARARLIQKPSVGCSPSSVRRGLPSRRVSQKTVVCEGGDAGSRPQFCTRALRADTNSPALILPLLLVHVARDRLQGPPFFFCPGAQRDG